MKNSYHTDLAIQFQLGLQDKRNWKNIPKSTLYSWKNKDFNKFVGIEISFSPEFDTFFLRFYISLNISIIQNLRHYFRCRKKKSLILQHVCTQKTQ